MRSGQRHRAILAERTLPLEQGGHRLLEAEVHEHRAADVAVGDGADQPALAVDDEGDAVPIPVDALHSRTDRGLGADQDRVEIVRAALAHPATFLNRRAGTPATTIPASTSRVTTAPAPT